MITEKYFSFSRLGWMLKHDFMGNQKSIFHHLIGFTAYFFIVMILGMQIEGGLNFKHTVSYPQRNIDQVHDNTSTENENESFILKSKPITSKNPITTGITIGGLNLLLLLGSYIYASTIAKPLNMRQERLSYLMLPATMLEKFISRVLFVTVGFLLTVVAAIVLAELLRYLFLPIFGFEEKFSHSLLPMIWNELIHNEISLAIIASASDASESSLTNNWWSVCNNFLFFHSLFILGGVLWLKKAFFKMIGVLLLGSIFIGILGALGRWRIEDVSANTETGIFLSILFSLFILFIWWLSYYIFAHKQVIQPK